MKISNGQIERSQCFCKQSIHLAIVTLTRVDFLQEIKTDTFGGWNLIIQIVYWIILMLRTINQVKFQTWLIPFCFVILHYSVLSGNVREKENKEKEGRGGEEMRNR